MKYQNFSFFPTLKKSSAWPKSLKIALFACTITVVSPLSQCLSAEVVTDRDITVVQITPEIPEWKIIWDRARSLVSGGQIERAVNTYAQLFAIKSNIEEANWEYCKILLDIKSYDVASKIISLLLENNPNKSEYLLAAGQIAVHQGKFAEAEQYFGLIFENDPSGENGDIALEGLAESLRARGLIHMSFPLMQQLAARRLDSELLAKLAEDAASLQKFNVAETFYKQLVEDENVNDIHLLKAAEVYEKTASDEVIKALYLRYLQRHPDYLPFRLKLLASNEQEGEYEAALAQLSHIIQIANPPDDYLLKAAQIAQTHLGRFDKALGFYLQYWRLHPENREVKGVINQLQKSMAGELQIIVENGGSDQLWRDLEELHQSREAIFNQMAVRLEEEKKTEPLMELYETQYNYGAATSETAIKLAKYYNSKQNFEKSLHFLDGVPIPKQDYSYHKLRAELETQLGYEIQALMTLKNVLELKKDDIEAIESAIQLAGSLGLVELQQQLFSLVADKGLSTVSDRLLRLHIKMLALNRVYGKGLDLCERAIFSHKDRPEILDFYLLKVDLLRKSGKKRAAEQLLRQLVNTSELKSFALLTLVENAIEDHALRNARNWFDLLDSVEPSIPKKNSNLFKQQKRLTRIRLYLEEGDADAALHLIDATLQEIQSGKMSSPSNAFYRAVLAEKYRLYLTLGDIIAADELKKNQFRENNLPPALIALRRDFINGEGQNNVIAGVDGPELGVLKISSWFDLLEAGAGLQDREAVLLQLMEINKKLEGSVRATNLAIDIVAAQSDFDRAIVLTEGLEEKYPAESGFCRMKLEFMARAGNHNEALENYHDCFPGIGKDPSEITEQGASIENRLFYARLLWGHKQYEDALAIYSRLLDPPVHQLLIDQFTRRNIDYQYLSREQSFWNSIILFSESDPEIIAELMLPDVLVENRGTITGHIVADNYEIYSWQKFISDEFQARKAIFNKNYNFAARSYEKLIEQDERTENKVDLASIYSRIGEYRKEAQVYEDISSTGEVTPELEESIARNILQIRPTVTLDANLEEREGREGVVDIRKTSVGTSLWFTPDLRKDFWVEYAYNTYESTNRLQKTSTNKIFGSMSYDFTDNSELVAGVGTEKFSDSRNSETQYNIQFSSQLDDYVSGFVLYQKEPVDDSIASLEANISRRLLQTGLTIESESGITFGGDIEYSLYSDENERNRFYLFSSYSLFGESLRFDMRYSYRYLTNKDINGPDGIASEDANNDIVRSYWSPDSFSEHRLGLQVKKDFFGYLTEVENKLSYFLFDAGISLEDEENVAYSTRFDIFLEMSPHLLLKGNFSFHSSDVYDEKLLSVSLHYSW